jgi:hypothetical protein
VVVAVGCCLVAARTPAAGQGSSGSRTWSPARTPDGQPDLRGIWRPNAPNASHSLEEGAEPENRRIGGRTEEEIARELATQAVVLVDLPDRRLPYLPAAEAIRTKHLENQFAPTELEHIEPEDRCLLNGVPRTNYRNLWQIHQIPGYVVITYEWVHGYRIIPIDGRPHIGSNIKLWNGDSVGRWEGNTLVVEVTNQNVETWFDSHGSFHSEDLRVVERYTLVDADTIRYEARIEDPKVFSRPWTIGITVSRHDEPGYEFIEEACHEGDRNAQNMLAEGRILAAKGVKGIHTHK